MSYYYSFRYLFIYYIKTILIIFWRVSWHP